MIVVYNLKMKALYKILGLSVWLLLAVGCGKEEVEYVVPASPVNFKVNVNVQDVTLKIPSNMSLFTAPRLEGEYVGYSGLLVVCSANPITGNIYNLFVYDLCCTNEKQQAVKVEKYTDGKVRCPKCGSVYNVLDGLGNPVSGPSQENLQRYTARYSSSEAGVFYITR